MDKQITGSVSSALIYLNALIIGAVVMGFEMLGSRYLFPYFGSGIGTWAGLISTVLTALTIGYLAGGVIIDHYPSPHVIAVCVAAAGIYLALIPTTADQVTSAILESCGSGPLGILLASATLLLFPLSLLGTFSPVAIRLQTRCTSESGRMAGLIYGVSTIGTCLEPYLRRLRSSPLSVHGRSHIYSPEFLLFARRASFLPHKVLPLEIDGC